MLHSFSFLLLFWTQPKAFRSSIQRLHWRGFFNPTAWIPLVCLIIAWHYSHSLPEQGRVVGIIRKVIIVPTFFGRIWDCAYTSYVMRLLKVHLTGEGSTTKFSQIRRPACWRQPRRFLFCCPFCCIMSCVSLERYSFSISKMCHNGIRQSLYFIQNCTYSYVPPRAPWLFHINHQEFCDSKWMRLTDSQSWNPRQQDEASSLSCAQAVADFASRCECLHNMLCVWYSIPSVYFYAIWGMIAHPMVCLTIVLLHSRLTHTILHSSIRVLGKSRSHRGRRRRRTWSIPLYSIFAGSHWWGWISPLLWGVVGGSWYGSDRYVQLVARVLRQFLVTACCFTTC